MDKRIYYSDLGYFYVEFYDDYNESKVLVRQQSYLYMRAVCNVKYNGDLDMLRNSIKTELDSKYYSFLEKKRKKDQLNKWDGFIDDRSRRDAKINQII